MLAGDMAMRLRKTPGSSSAYSLASIGPAGGKGRGFTAGVAVSLNHKRRRPAADALTTLSREGLCGEGKAVQRIPRSLTRSRQVARVHQPARESPWLLPEARDSLRRLALRGASAMLAGDMAMRLRKTPGSSSAYSLA